MRRRHHINQLAVGLLLLITTFAVYRQVREFDFIYYDDGGYVFENHHVLKGWTLDGLKWAFTTQHSRHWHPLTWLSHMTDCELFGPDPGWHHLTSLFLHLANTLLLFFLFYRLTGALLKSALVAALFALHPLHVETVVWVSDRKDLLCAFFWILTMWAYIFYSERPGILRYFAVFLFFVLALLSKSMAVTLPFVLLLLDYWPLRRFQREGRKIFWLLAEKAGLFCLGGTALLVAVLSMYWSNSAKLWMVSTDKELVGKALVNSVIYIYKMIWPFELMVPYSNLGKIAWWQAGGAAILLIVVTVFAFRQAKRKPYLLFGWLWYLITISPVIGLVYGSPQKIADRYTYLPLVGLFIAMVWGIEDIMRNLTHRRSVLAATAGVLISALAIISWVQTGYWKNSFSILKHDLALNPGNYFAMNSLGNILAEQGDLRAAVSYYSQALEIKPDYAKVHTNLGVALRKLGESDQAMAHYSEALRVNPGDWKAYYNLGNLLAGKGDIEAAIVNYSEALKLKPDHAKTHNNLGTALIRGGGVDEAISHFREAARINPDFVEAHYNLGRARAEQGNMEKAMAHYAEAIRIRPNYTKALRDLEILKRRTTEPAGTGNPIKGLGKK